MFGSSSAYGGGQPSWGSTGQAGGGASTNPSPWSTPSSYAAQQQPQQQQPAYGGGTHQHQQQSYGGQPGSGWGSATRAAPGPQMGASGAGQWMDHQGHQPKVYLPGYLLQGHHSPNKAISHNDPSSSSGANAGANSSWSLDSPSKDQQLQGAGGSPSHFGGGSLFGPRDKDGTPSRSPKGSLFTLSRASGGEPQRRTTVGHTDDDLPPTAMLEDSTADSESSSFAFAPASPTKNGFNTQGQQQQLRAHTPLGSPTKSTSPLPPSSSSSSSQQPQPQGEGTTLIIFGFPPSPSNMHAHELLAHFSALGPVISSSLSPSSASLAGSSSSDEQPPEGANWFTVTFKEPWVAARALRRNGELLDGGRVMIGVKPLLASDSSLGAVGAAAGQQQSLKEKEAVATPSRAGAGTAPSSYNPIGKSATILPSSSAFAPRTAAAAGTPLRSAGSLFGGGSAVNTPQQGAGGAGGGKSFAERAAGASAGQGAPLAGQQGQQQQQQQQQGMLGKISDLVFGW